jgi:hypothetical protein
MAAFIVASGATLLAQGCSAGSGTGAVAGMLDVPNCWSGKYNLDPNFFAADPYDDSLFIRIQNGGDYAQFSDGLSILVDNVHVIRGDAPFSPPLLNHVLAVSLAPGVTVAGAPVVPQPEPALVHATVYLQKSCPTQNVALYALESVSLDAQGNCNPAPTGPYILQCNSPNVVGVAGLSDAGPTLPDGGDGGGPDASTDASLDAAITSHVDAAVDGSTILPASPAPPLGHSTITFQSLFDGNIDESSAAERLTQGTFTFYLGDPRDACPGGVGPPPPCRGVLTGSFQFYFERGQPGQPFP